MKKALVVATVIGFINFERNDIAILQQMGYEVHCATNLNNENEKTKDINVIRHQIDFERNPFCKQTLVAYRQLKKLMESEKFELIHCHTPVGGVLARLVARKQRGTGLKVIYTAHGFHFYKGAPLKNWLLFYPFEWICSWMTDVLITINQEDYKLAKEKFHAKKVEYIPGVGVDVNKFSNMSGTKEKIRKRLGIPEDMFMILSVGELNVNKNHQVVIKALAELKNERIHYYVAGEGVEKQYLSRLAKKTGVGKQVHLLGYRTDVQDLYGAADVFCFLSLREGLGLAAVEAMAAGLTLIASNRHGIRDYARDGVTGYCINQPTSVAEVKKALFKVYSDRTFCNQCSTNNKEVAMAFDISVSKNKMEEIYQKIEE